MLLTLDSDYASTPVSAASEGVQASLTYSIYLPFWEIFVCLLIWEPVLVNGSKLLVLQIAGCCLIFERVGDGFICETVNFIVNWYVCVRVCVCVS